MGFNVSKPTDVVQQEHQKMVERILLESRKRYQSVIKLLLLGTADAGKSTIMKQMRILHGNGFHDDEIRFQKSVIIGNIIHALSCIVRAMKDLNIAFQNPEHETDAEQVLNLDKIWSECQCVYPQDWLRLKALWADSSVQTCLARANEYQIPSSTKYFCDAIDRISASDYTPTQQDMLYSRVSTLGIVEIEFTLKGLNLKVIDVGGQRSERKKWIHCFENIDAIIYVAAISEYNQLLCEDQRVNRLFESIKLFAMIINSRWFTQSSVVLFLNKKDLFEEKLKTYPLSATFPKYKGDNNYDQACSFIKHRFLRENRNGTKTIYTHETCATETKNVKFVLESCFDILLKGALLRSGMV